MKTCTRKKQYDEYKCDICQKIFQYICRLEAHRKRCMQIKHRINHDDEYAIEFSQNEFVPSFVSPYNESSDCHAEDITSKCNYKKNVEIEPSDCHVEDVNTDSTNNVEIDSTNDVISSNDCWRVYKSNQRTRKKIDDVINQLNYIHIGRLNNNENTSSLNEIVAYVSVDSVNEGIVCASFVTHLQSLVNSPDFYKIIAKNFDESQLGDNNFCCWLAKKLDIRHSRFVLRLKSWKNKKVVESRGRKSISVEIKQVIYNEWKNNAIYSVDRGNNRDKVKISKHTFLRKYGDIAKEDHIDEEKSKKDMLFYACPRMIVTCTICELQRKLMDAGINVSYGTVISMKPFYITYATEKENVLCMCKLCLNARLLFNPLMENGKSSGGTTFTSITFFFYGFMSVS